MPSSSSRFEKNEYLPSPAADEEEEGAALLGGGGGLDFHEILDEEALKHKFTVVNRAPVMMAWACVVAERLGFSRDEALSIGKLQHSLLLPSSSPNISAKKTPFLLACTCTCTLQASVYTEMNAVSKGVSLGIFDKKRESDLKAAHAEVEAQPYVDLLGRRIPLFRIASGSWRAFTTEDNNGCSTPVALLLHAHHTATSHAHSGRRLRQCWAPCAFLRKAMMIRWSLTEWVSRFMLTFGPMSVSGVNVES
jgi:hypothetical protein